MKKIAILLFSIIFINNCSLFDEPEENIESGLENTLNCEHIEDCDRLRGEPGYYSDYFFPLDQKLNLKYKTNLNPEFNNSDTLNLQTFPEYLLFLSPDSVNYQSLMFDTENLEYIPNDTIVTSDTSLSQSILVQTPSHKDYSQFMWDSEQKLYRNLLYLDHNDCDNATANGVWDNGEPYVDENENSIWDSGEDFTDIGDDNDQCKIEYKGHFAPYNNDNNTIQVEDPFIFKKIIKVIDDLSDSVSLYLDLTQYDTTLLQLCELDPLDECAVYQDTVIYEFRYGALDIDSAMFWDIDTILQDTTIGDLADNRLYTAANGIYDVGEEFVDANQNGVYDGGNETYTDYNDNGIWDAAEIFEDVNGNGIWDAAEIFEDVNGNGTWDNGESFDDINDNGTWDNEELYLDENGNGVWDEDELYLDENGNGAWDPAEAFTDENGNNTWDDTELYLDENGNGAWDPAEAFTDGNGIWDPEEDYIDENGNGIWDPEEAFTDGNGVWNPAEDFDDLNGNGLCDVAENFVDLAQPIDSFVPDMTYTLANGLEITPIHWETVRDTIIRIYTDFKEHNMLLENRIIDEISDEKNEYKIMKTNLGWINNNNLINSSDYFIYRVDLHSNPASIMELIYPSYFNYYGGVWDDEFNVFNDNGWTERSTNMDSILFYLPFRDGEFVENEYSEDFIDLENGIYDLGEDFEDDNQNGIWDEGEDFIDFRPGNSARYNFKTSYNVSYGDSVKLDLLSFRIKLNGDDSDNYDFEFIDNGIYNEGESFTDALNGVYDSGEDFIDAGEMNGVWDEGELFTDDYNGIYDLGEDFSDTIIDETLTDVTFTNLMLTDVFKVVRFASIIMVGGGVKYNEEQIYWIARGLGIVKQQINYSWGDYTMITGQEWIMERYSQEQPSSQSIDLYSLDELANAFGEDKFIPKKSSGLVKFSPSFK